MKSHILLTAALLLPGVLVAQTNQASSLLDRGATNVATYPSPVNFTGWRYFQVEAPKERLFGNPGLGHVPTANLVHMTYFDMDSVTGFVPELQYRRSTDGGYSWGKPLTLHRLTGGELIGKTGARIVCEGHNVAVLFRSSVLTPTGGAAVIGYSSSDQGQTWKGPTLLTPAFAGSSPKIQHDTGSPSSDEFRAIYTGGKIHILYEGVYTAPGAPLLEESFYCRAAIDAQGALQLEQADVPMSNFAQPNMYDVDNVEIAGDGMIIVCLWQDQTTLGNDYNNTVIRISRDGGTTWQPELRITNFDTTTHPNHPSTDGNSSVAVTGVSIVVICEDHRDQGAHGRYDEVFAYVSVNAGVTFSQPILISGLAQNNDVDDNKIAAQNGKFVINWFEDLGQGNAANHNMVVVATAQELLNSQFKAIDLSALGGMADQQVCESLSINGAGQYIAISGETGGATKGTSEATVLSWSSDGGKSWETSNGSEGERDVDDPAVTVTGNGDVVQFYIEDFPPGGNNGNQTLVSGLKMPRLIDNTGNSQGLELRGAAQSAGGFAVVLISGQAPTTTNRIGIYGTMFKLNLDAFTSIGLTLPALFVAAVDAQGGAKFPAIPNLSKLAGQDVWYLAVTLTAQGLLESTDPKQF